MRLVVVAALRLVCFAWVLLTAAATSSSARHPGLRRFATDKAQSDCGHHSLEQSHSLRLTTGEMLEAPWREARNLKRAVRGHTKDYAVSHRRELSNATSAAAVVALSVDEDGGAGRRHNIIVIEGTDARHVRIQRVEHGQNMTVIITEIVYQDRPAPHTAEHRHRHHHQPHNFSTPSLVDVRDGSIFARYNGSVHGHNITEAMVRVHELRMRRARDRRNESEHAYFVRWADLAHNATTTRPHNTSSSNSTTGTSGHSEAQHNTITRGTHNTTYLHCTTDTSSYSDRIGRGAKLAGEGRQGSGASSNGTLVEEKREVMIGVNRVEAVEGGLSMNGLGRGEVGEVGGAEQTSHTLARITPTAEAQVDGTHAHASRSVVDGTRHTNGSLSTKGVMIGQARGGVAGVEGGMTPDSRLNKTKATQATAAIDMVPKRSSTNSALFGGKAREVASGQEAEGRKQGPIGAPSDDVRFTGSTGRIASSGDGGGGGGRVGEKSGMAVLQDTTGHDEVTSTDAAHGKAGEHQVTEAVVVPQREQANPVNHVVGKEEDNSELTGYVASRPNTGGERQTGDGRNAAMAGDSVSQAALAQAGTGAENGTGMKPAGFDAQAGMRAPLDRRGGEGGRDGQRPERLTGLEVGMKGEREKDTQRAHEHGSRSRGQPPARDRQSSSVADGSGFGGVGNDAEDHLISTVQGAEATARVYERDHNHEPPSSPIVSHSHQNEAHHSGDGGGDRRDDQGGNDHIGREDARRSRETIHEGNIRADEAVEAVAGGLSDPYPRREQHRQPQHEAKGDGHRHSYDGDNDDGRAKRAFRLRGSGDRGQDGLLRVNDEDDDDQPEAGDREERTSAVPGGDDHSLQEYEGAGGEHITEKNGRISNTSDAGGSNDGKVKKQKTPLFDWGALLKGLRVGMERNGSMWVGSAQQAAEKQKQQLLQMQQRQHQQQQQQQKDGKGQAGMRMLLGIGDIPVTYVVYPCPLAAIRKYAMMTCMLAHGSGSTWQ